MSVRLLLLAAATVAAVGSSFGGFNVDLVSGSATKWLSGRYMTMTVLSNSTIRVTGSGTMDMLLVGGGGGGGYGSSWAGGGGGGGQVLYRQSVEVEAKDYEIVIGAGGAVSANGGNTTAFGLTALGGGAGGTNLSPNGADGGNGGGAAAYSESYTGGKGTEGGHNGGAGVADNASWTLYGGGGGGAGGDGSTAIGTGGTTTGSIPGFGGAGRSCDITGEDVVYGAGGGGCCIRCSSLPIGGDGGGRGSYNINDTQYPATPGVDFRGGGGGGGGSRFAGAAASGGCGVVILRFEQSADPSIPLVATVSAGAARRAIEGEDEILIFDDEATVSFDENGAIDVLVVGGGGAGGDRSGGGGGGGGVVYETSVPVVAGLKYDLHVGTGGIASTGSGKGGNGEDSTAFGFVAKGGGGGGCCSDGNPGGSGGGAGGCCSGASKECAGGVGFPLQGFDGGVSTNNGQWYTYGGGGGGAGGVGGRPRMYQKVGAVEDYGTAGTGGIGRVCAIWGGERYYGGGGGGGAVRCVDFAPGGLGGGGRGGMYQNSRDVLSADSILARGENGVDGLGGGGGGGMSVGTSVAGNGGRGTVIVRYRRKVPEARAVEPETSSGGTYRKYRGCGIHTFDESGTFTVAGTDPIVADILLVGGGGGGGYSRGGGGGGGDVVVLSNVTLSAGNYTVTIGVGGVGGTSGDNLAANGGITSVTSADGLLSYEAFGGGAGGSGGVANDFWFRRNGADGACGGGGGGTTISGSANPGGRGLYGRDGGLFICGGTHFMTWAGGGAGAGESGGDGVWTGVDATSYAGKGGDGLFCDFSGENLCYGGGGGGGNGGRGFDLGLGGDGGGGRGGYGGEALYNKDPVAGMNGRGGGGGGGYAYGATGYPGANGGRGVVIIRYHLPKTGMLLLFR